jgi:hypothetical protein
MSHRTLFPINPAGRRPLSYAALAQRALTFLSLSAVLGVVAACAERADPTGPLADPTGSSLATASSSVPADLTADAIGRILPALEQDAAAPLGNALTALDAKLRDRKATGAVRDRAAAAVQNVLAQFTGARPDAADLDAMRLEVDQVRASLR